MKASYLKQEQPIKITVEGGFNTERSLELTLPADATIEDWIDIFKTILVHQTFNFDIVRELLEPDCQKDNIPYQEDNTPDNIPTSQSTWKEEF